MFKFILSTKKKKYFKHNENKTEIFSDNKEPLDQYICLVVLCNL